ncbi:endo alpha-1,4 polygalactosaminidase, partial [bacterium]|nr:endo alpha-1,4 polygalactosaminidase [bacterium]
MHRMLVVLLVTLLICVAQSASAAVALPTQFSVALYYAVNPPLDELKVFDVVVVDPDAVGVTPRQYKAVQSELFAYVSVGEADPHRGFFSKIHPAWLIGENTAWKSKLVDLSNPAWRTFFL